MSGRQHAALLSIPATNNFAVPRRAASVWSTDRRALLRTGERRMTSHEVEQLLEDLRTDRRVRYDAVQAALYMIVEMRRLLN